jgi:hypothetical protein
MLKSFDPRRVMLIIGSHRVSGFMEGEPLTGEPMADGSTSVAGMDGDVARAMNTDPRWTFTANLLQSSDSNDVLSAIYQLDKATNGNGVVPFLLQDNNGTTIISGAQCWVLRPANISYGSTITGRAWTIHVVAEIENIGASGITN